jgi:hypothetical protein
VRKLASIAAIGTTGALAVWSCSVPDFQFDPPSTGDTSTVDSSAATTTRSTVDSSSSDSSASSTVSSSASTGSGAGGTGGGKLGVPCFNEPCGKTEVCCVKGDDADNTHACATNAAACTNTPVSCRVDSDCGNGFLCCGQFDNDGWPSAVYCTQQCSGGGQLHMCADSAECAGKACQQAFCKCNPNDPTCFCFQGQCQALVPLICSSTPYKACF